MKYFITYKIDGRISVEVEAGSLEEAVEKSYGEFAEADLSKMEYVDADPVSCTDENGNFKDLV